MAKIFSPADRHHEGRVQRLVSALRVGDHVDLEGDIFADPDRERLEFTYEFAVVEAIEHETGDCTRVDFEGGFSCGFPPDHWLDVDGEQDRGAAP